MKSPVSRAMSTRAYRAAPGCFLYADRRASSRAAIRRSAEMPFSRSSTWTASTISLDIRSALQQVAAIDVGVRDGDDPGVGGDGYLLVVRAHELAGEAPAAAVVLARAHARALSDVAAEVVGLGERALRTRRGDLEPRLHQHVAQVARHALAQFEVDAARPVDHQPHRGGGHGLEQQDLDV